MGAKGYNAERHTSKWGQEYGTTRAKEHMAKGRHYQRDTRATGYIAKGHKDKEQRGTLAQEQSVKRIMGHKDIQRPGSTRENGNKCKGAQERSSKKASKDIQRPGF